MVDLGCFAVGFLLALHWWFSWSCYVYVGCSVTFRFSDMRLLRFPRWVSVVLVA